MHSYQWRRIYFYFLQTLYISFQLARVATFGWRLFTFITSDGNLLARPLELFSFSSRIIALLWVYMWNYTLFTKRPHVMRLINSSSHLHRNYLITHSSRALLAAKSFLYCAIPFIFTTLDLLGHQEYDELVGIIDKLSGCILLNRQLCWFKNSAILFATGVRLVLMHFSSCCDALNLLIFRASFEYADKINRDMKKVLDNYDATKDPEVGQNGFIVARIQTMLKELQEYFESLNEFASSLVICWFCLGLPWIPLRFVENMAMVGNHHQLRTHNFLYTCAYFCLYVGSLLWGAHAHAKVQTFFMNRGDFIIFCEISGIIFLNYFLGRAV